MSRSISARIFQGFVIVTIVFSCVMGYTLFRMHQVRQELDRVNRTYLTLTLVLDRLYLSQENVVSILEQRVDGQQPPLLVRRQVQLALQFRQQQINNALRLLSSENSSIGGDDERLRTLQTELKQLVDRFAENAADFQRLFASSSASTSEDPEKDRALLRSEAHLTVVLGDLAKGLRRDLSQLTVEIERDQQTSVGAGVALVLVALIMSLAVTAAAARTLRPLRTLVDTTQRLSQGDYAARAPVVSRDELGVLAHEFNSMAQAIEEREQRLIRSERLAAAGELAAHITHEVRNPLNSIALNTDLLEEEIRGLRPGEDSETLNLCRAIQREVDRLTEITEEYLRFARLPKPNLTKQDINTLLRDVLAFVNEELKAHGVVVQLNLADDLPGGFVDEAQLRQALLNLIRNAREAMPKGGTLSVATRRDNQQIEIRISDTGSGIPAAVKQRIFDPFFSTKDGGTGLGLALTLQIIQQHGGRIEATSEEGHGTSFALHLPESA